MQIDKVDKETLKGVKPYKVILVGPQGVGKSSLLHRII
jgi:GTPase SAR1 family protein